MSGFVLFVYWFYLIPTLMGILVGMAVVEKGLLPMEDEFGFQQKTSLYLSVITTSLIPVYNILYTISGLLLLAA